jgi:cytochrome c oxidase subunit IV
VILIRPEVEQPMFRALTIAFIVLLVGAAVAAFLGMGWRRTASDSAARFTPPRSLG